MYTGKKSPDAYKMAMKNKKYNESEWNENKIGGIKL